MGASIGSVAGAVAALLLAGCASSDISNDAKTTREVVECLPTDTPAPTEIARAIWYPKSGGFGSTDASPQGRSTGLLALAGGKLWFMGWDSEVRHYDVLRTIAISDAVGIKISRLGPASMLVVESRNYSLDAFELMHGGQFASDAGATQDLFDKLQALGQKIHRQPLNIQILQQRRTSLP